MELFAAQIITTLLFFVLTLGSCLLPLLLKYWAGSDNDMPRVQNLLNALNFVAGGVFIGTILLHLLPDVHDELTLAFMDYGLKTSYPLPEFIVGVGLLTFLLLEQSILAFQSKGEEFNTKVVNFEEKSTDSSELKTLNGYDTLVGNASSSCEVEKQKSDEMIQTTSTLRSYALLIALSIHNVFEGMVVGFQDDPTTVWELFGALIMHKMLVAFSFGSRILAAKHSITTCHYIGLLTVFTLMGPLGCVIGTVMTQSPDSPSLNLAEALLVGLATGSFIFVTFFEIIRFEGGKKTNLIMCILVVAGFAAMALEILSHKHEHVEKNVHGVNP